MIDFKTYRLLNEMSFSLGVKSPQNLGLTSNMPVEAGLPPELLAKLGKGRPPMPGSEVPQEVPGEEGLDGEEDLDHDEDDLHHDEEDLDHDEEDLDHDEEDHEHDEEGHDVDDELDHEDDLAGLEGEEGGEEGLEGGLDGKVGPNGLPLKKPLMLSKKPVTPFMKMMKKEACEDDGEKGEEGKDGEEGPVFMMKKAKKCGADMGKGDKLILDKSKKSSSGAAGEILPMKKCKAGCKACKAKMKKMQKESTVADKDYARPKSYDASRSAWDKSIREQMASVDMKKKHFDGMANFQKEDLLLPLPADGGLEAVAAPTPGDVGHAPQTRIGGNFDFTAESIDKIAKQVAEMSKK